MMHNWLLAVYIGFCFSTVAAFGIVFIFYATMVQKADVKWRIMDNQFSIPGKQLTQQQLP